MKKIVILLVSLTVLVLLSFSVAYLVIRHTSVSFGDKVAVINVHGEIFVEDTGGLLFEEVVTPRDFKKALKKAEDDASVKAIVLEINSPGGSIVASEEIADAIKGASKPTVAWLSEIATSGGYYIASACDYIVADRATITGSIGVISMSPEFSRLLDKIGVNVTVIKGGKYKDFSTGYRPITEEEKQMIQDVVSEIYEQFIKEVATNRNLSEDYVKLVAEGKIYSGTSAKALRLVDDVGNRDFAIRKAASMGGIVGKPQVVTYRRGGIFGELVSVASARFGYGFAKGLMEWSKGITIE